MEAVTIELKHPVTFGAELVDKLTFSRMVRLGDMKDHVSGKALTMEELAQIIGRLTGYDRQVIMALEGEDVARVLEAAAPFFGSPQTGGLPSAF